MTREKRNGVIEYSHKALQPIICHPDQKQILPLMPEAIKNSDGTKKQDCEINAAKLLYIFQLVLELTDPLFQHCRKAARTHHTLWVDLSALFRWFMFESFEHMLYYFLQENGHGPPVII